MGVIVTTTAGLCIWIVLWALNVSGFDGILIAASMMLVALMVQSLVPKLTSRKEE